MSFYCESYVLSGRGLCVGPIPRPEESYRVWHVLSLISKPQHLGGVGHLGGGKSHFVITVYQALRVSDITNIYH